MCWLCNFRSQQFAGEQGAETPDTAVTRSHGAASDEARPHAEVSEPEMRVPEIDGKEPTEHLPVGRRS